MIALQELMKEIKALAPIPAVANHLLSVTEKPDYSMSEVARVIQYDPVITAGVLKTCNSAFFGLRHPAESIRDAVNMLGTDKVIQLALVKSGSQVLSGPQQGYGLEPGEIWTYSVSSAILAKAVAQKLNLENKNTIFTAALVKDMGKIILEKYVGAEAKKIQTLMETQGLSFREAEKELLGIDHAELGAMIGKMWKFSPKMVHIIRHHHLSDPDMMRDKEVAAVYLADCICMMMGSGVGKEGLAHRFRDEVLRKVNLSADDISLIMADFNLQCQELENLLNMG